MSFERLASAACALTCALAACSSGEPGAHDFTATDGSFFVRDAGGDARADGASDGASDADMDAPMDKGPVVTIMNPAPSSDPLAGPVLTGPSVQVQCDVQARAGGPAVDPGSVLITAFRANSSMPAHTPIKGTLDGTNLYVATVPLETLPTGRVRFECSAAEAVATNPSRTVKSVETFYDAGPVITFLNLNENSIVARGKSTETDISIQFKVEPARLAEGDTRADPTDVRLLINDVPVDLPPPVAGVYTKSLDFSTHFRDQAFTSFSVMVTAKNSRGEKPSEVRKKLVVRVDGEGPVIKFTSPSSAAGIPIVGGTVEVVFEVSDALAGVAQSSDLLRAEIKYAGHPNVPYTVTRVDPGSNAYTFSFEASRFSDTRDIVALVTAHDTVGNESSEDFPLHLDTVPPWIDLDPAPLVEVSAGTPRYCSAEYDPLGWSPQDGQVVGQEIRFRALVWERGIEIASATETFLSGVNDNTVRFYSQSDRSTPLIVDQTGNDGICDAINSSAQELGTKTPFTIGMSPITPGGVPLNPGQTTDVPVSCLGSPATSIQGLCGNKSELSFAPAHIAGGPAIYAHGVMSGDRCTGISFDMQVPAGEWACVAVAARDRAGSIGNLGVSKPVRVCRWRNPGDCGLQVFDQRPGAPVQLANVPANLTCTDGCTMPSHWTNFAPDQPSFPKYLVR